MATGKMYDCDVKVLFKVDGKKEHRWMKRSVSDVAKASSKDGIRCTHCHGRVRIHKQKVAHGPADHVEHIEHDDSVNCLGGMHFCGEHKASTTPVK